MTWPFGELRPYSYGALAVDPPWPFETYSGERVTPHRAAQDHYQTMTIEDIARLPIGRLAARDCALFLWVVDYHLPAAIEVTHRWGFTFKTRVFTWDKGKMSHGFWSRKETELCFLATRGAPRRRDMGVREKIAEKPREHSRKPEEFYARVTRLVDGPYAELFARERRDGWHAWGNEIGKFESQKEPACASA